MTFKNFYNYYIGPSLAVVVPAENPICLWEAMVGRLGVQGHA